MIELFFMVCQIQDPQLCSERSLVYSDVSTQTCVMGAQMELAKWVTDHPQYRIKSYKCQPVNLRETEA